MHALASGCSYACCRKSPHRTPPGPDLFFCVSSARPSGASPPRLHPTQYRCHVIVSACASGAFVGPPPSITPIPSLPSMPRPLLLNGTAPAAVCSKNPFPFLPFSSLPWVHPGSCRPTFLQHQPIPCTSHHPHSTCPAGAPPTVPCSTIPYCTAHRLFVSVFVCLPPGPCITPPSFSLKSVHAVPLACCNLVHGATHKRRARLCLCSAPVSRLRAQTQASVPHPSSQRPLHFFLPRTRPPAR